MASMAQTTSTSPFQGFSVYQPALGAPLQFLPAVGTKELEQLVDAYLPGPASAPEKRASISMDFFDHYGQTGENFKYYAVYTPVATPESAQSSYSVSPVTSDLGSYSSPSQASTPAAGGAVKKARVAARKPVAKQEKSDFSNLPGMKILTKDGTDVTNSVSRGCKSKEQRDHAHLMRILKACDACKKKKIRCDPSHKKRAASQMDSETKSEAAKPVKKTKKTTSMPLTERTVSKPPPAETLFQMDDIGLSMDFSTPVDESWEQFLTFNDEPAAATIPQDFYGAIPQEFDFFFGAENNNNFSPSASGSSVSPIQPVTPVSSGMVPQVDDFAVFGHDRPLAFLQSEDNSLEPGLPYLNPAGQHGSNYVDFNLFSPSSSFVDEEPKLLKSGGKRSAAASPTQSAGSSNASVSSTGLVSDQDWLFDQSHFTLSPSQSEWLVPDGEVSARQLATVDGERGVYAGSQPYHANDAGQGTIRSMHAVTRSHCPEPMRKNSPVAAVAQKGESLPGVTGLGGSSAATSSAPLVAQTVIPHVSRQNIIPEGTANAHVSSQTVSPTVRSSYRLYVFELYTDSRKGTPSPRFTPPSSYSLNDTCLSTTVGGNDPCCHIAKQRQSKPNEPTPGLTSRRTPGPKQPTGGQLAKPAKPGCCCWKRPQPRRPEPALERWLEQCQRSSTSPRPRSTKPGTATPRCKHPTAPARDASRRRRATLHPAGATNAGKLPVELPAGRIWPCFPTDDDDDGHVHFANANANAHPRQSTEHTYNPPLPSVDRVGPPAPPGQVLWWCYRRQRKEQLQQHSAKLSKKPALLGRLRRLYVHAELRRRWLLGSFGAMVMAVRWSSFSAFCI